MDFDGVSFYIRKATPMEQVHKNMVFKKSDWTGLPSCEANINEGGGVIGGGRDHMYLIRMRLIEYMAIEMPVQ